MFWYLLLILVVGRFGSLLRLSVVCALICGFGVIMSAGCYLGVLWS